MPTNRRDARKTTTGGALPRRRRLRKLDRARLLEHLDRMAEGYQEHRALEVRAADARTRSGLRRRADGRPSARPPVPTLPLSYWATILPAPDAFEEDGVDNLLADYVERLRQWKALGLYDGPTELTFVGKDPDEST